MDHFFSNKEIAKLFRSISAAYTVKGNDYFKIIAYDKAADSIEHATSELKDLWDDGKLDTIAGLGKSIISHLDEIFKTGQSKYLNEILKKVNPAVFPLLEVPGIGPKKAEKLVETLKITDPAKVFDQVEAGAKSGKIAEIPSFGEKSAEDILEGLERYHKWSIKEHRMVLPQADTIANEII